MNTAAAPRLRRRVAAALALLVPLAPATPAGAETIELRDALVLPRVGSGGRRPVHTDAVEAMIAARGWAPPQAGTVVVRPDGTEAVWTEATAGADGWLNDDALRGGYAYWAVEAAEDAVMTLAAQGHAMVYVNGAPRAGDPYRNGWVRLPVHLRRGRNDLLFHCTRGGVRAALSPVPGPAYFELREPTLPTLVRGEGWAEQGAVVIVNATDEPMVDLVVRAGGSRLPVHETTVPRVPPMSIRKVPFWFGGIVPPDERAVTVDLELVRHADGVVRRIDTGSVSVPVRRADEVHRRTFVSAVDGSVQYYAVRPMVVPEDATAPERPALFLSLHGAAVPGARQAAVYAAKSWGHVVAPTNRRPFGFDWEDWGRLDAMEALEHAARALGTDPDRTYLTGHSMGGHGTWHLGLTFPDRFAAIGPSAGWRTFWSYGGAVTYDDPTPIEALLLRARNPSDSVALLRNALHYGVYILHGDRDDNVPVEQARFMHEHLSAFHDDVVYHEEAGAGHWWGNRCCDWDPMFEFFRAHARPDPATVDHVEFHTANPGISHASRWVAIEQQVVPLALSSVTADIDRAERRFAIATDNVARLALRLDHLAGEEPVTVEIDGVRLAGLPVPDGGAPLALVRQDGDWAADELPLAPGQKGPHRYGPFKDAFRNRVVFVVGTRGTPVETTWARNKARYDAETFWYRGNAAVEVVDDEAFDAMVDPDRNVVLYGNADTNAAWSSVLGPGPVDVRRGAVRIGERTLEDGDLGCLLIRPRFGSDSASVGVVGGTGPDGMALTDRLPYFVSGVAYPDLLVMGPETLERGTAGIRVAGVFGADWSVESGDFAWAPEAAGSR